MDARVFEAYSQYYDLLYRDKNYEAETAYIHNLLKTFHPSSKTILELGCGTGIHAGKLASRGYTVHGIDQSDTMLRMALERRSEMSIETAERLSFMEGDIRNYKTANRFDVVISLFHVMSYMTSTADLEMAIKTAETHLTRGGVFVFDCWHGPAVLHDKPVSRTKTFENETIAVKRTSVPELFPDRHVVDVHFDIDIQNKKTNTHTKLHEVHAMRYLFTEELKSLLDENGMDMIHAEEWLNKEPLSERTWNACYVCRHKP